MNYKISYQRAIKPIQGTVYDQTITCQMTWREIDEFNLLVNKEHAKIRAKNLKTSYDVYRDTFLQNVGRGINYTKLTTMLEFCVMFGITKDKRWKYRNTILKINVV